MIPKNILPEHILKAIEEVRKNGIPEGRESKKFLIETDQDYFPPKYVISLANKYANGQELNPSEFSGGTESNNFLSSLGFKIVEVESTTKSAKSSPQKTKEILCSADHNGERCANCKENVEELLRKLFGRVEQNYKFEVGTHPEDFLNSHHYDKLKEIYTALQNHRGFAEFAKAKTLPNCDFFVSDTGPVVEFDESQHFTLPRKIALRLYPETLELGFNREKWITLCDKVNARDNDPPYRDEQRAWYDTLRDFLPAMNGLKPTIRLFAPEHVWCTLNPNNELGVQRFRRLLKKEPGKWEIEVMDEPNPFLSRIIIADEWQGDPNKAKSVLEAVCENWPKGKKTKFLLTCGGFTQFDWPKYISRTDVGDNLNSNGKVVNALVKEAEKHVRFVLSGGVSDKLKEFTDYITLGIDSSKEKISTTKNYIGQLHIELVFLVDLRSNKFSWTGKSYPTTHQQKGLVRISNLETHFFDLDLGNVMVLGCHDLAMFNPRSKNAKGWRSQVNKDFRELANIKHPICVLHHPHTTVKKRTWLNSWNNLNKTLPSIHYGAGAGRYFETHRDQSEWDALKDVLNSTKYASAIDFIVWKD